MIAYFEQFVNSLKNPPKSPFFKGGGIKFYLILTNVLLVFFLILLSNLKVLPIQGFGDFAFFTVLFLIFALYRPGWAFLFFVGTIALENINLAPGNLGIAVRPYQFFGALSILAIVIRKIAGRLNFQLAKIIWPDYLVIFFAVVGFVANLNKGGASIKQSIIVFSFAALYFLVRNFVQNIDDLKRIIPFFLSSAIVIIFYGLWQNVRFMQGLSHFEAMPGRPNATFTEADWLGIYLVLILAVLYSLIYFFRKNGVDSKSLISNDQFPISKQIPITNIQFPKNLFLVSLPRRRAGCFLFLVAVYTLLILTVSRSAWLGALAVTIVYLVAILKIPPSPPLKKGENKWNWEGFFQQLLFLAMAMIGSVAVVYTLNLTNFQLFNRIQSTGTGLQKITISCWSQKCDVNGCIQREMPAIENIKSIQELEKYGCRHINLEEIDNEKAAGNIIYEIDRQDPNVNIRKEIYQKSWVEIKKHPILGIGWSNISLALGKDERGAGLNSSNIFLEVWLGTGIFGLISFVILIVNISFQAAKNILKKMEIEAKVIGIFFLLGLVAIIIPNLFNAGIFLGIIWLYLGLANLKYE